MMRKETIEELHRIAAAHGGKCVSTTFLDRYSKLKWQCKELHIWEAIPINILAGHWCPECAGIKKGTLEEMQQIAQERGGKCLSPIYINSSEKMLWECKKLHRWEARPANIKKHWCPECAGITKGTLEEMQQIAQERGGKCLSTTYINASTKMLWQCKRGHQWQATGGNIKAGKWCPGCARKFCRWPSRSRF
jgi:hypothetical protein